MIELESKVGRTAQKDKTVQENDRVREVRLVALLTEDSDGDEEKNGISTCWL